MSPLLATLKYVVIPLVLFYAIVPLTLWTFPSVLRSFVFLNFLRRPFATYTDPIVNYDLPASRNFYLEHDDVRLGVWQISASHLHSKFESDVIKSNDEFELLLATPNTPIILYCHGNAFDRTYRNRRKMYTRMSSEGYNVLAVDYRGFGDSTGTPTENGAALDVQHVYKYAVRHAGSNPVIIWGHSLGTAISTKAVIDMTADGNLPLGLVLEAPFNALHEVVSHHPITIPFRRLPYFDALFVTPLKAGGRAKMVMNTDERLERVRCPVMILHAHDDRIVPFQLTKKLEASAHAHGTDIILHEFDGEHGYGHNEIYRVPTLGVILKEFVRKCANL